MSLRWFLLIAVIPALLVSAKAASTAEKTVRRGPIKSVASFQFCFEIPHGRCFNTTATGRLRQVGGRSPSQAFVQEKQMLGLEKEIARFMKSTFSAAPREARDCQQTLAYRTFDPATFELKTESKRCLEFLNKSDTANLAKLVQKLSLATKPR